MNIAQKLAHLFFPRQSNNHKAKILHSSSLFLVAFFFVSFQAAIQFVLPAGKVLGYATNISTDEIIRLTNEKRAQNGLSSLSYNGTLAQAAQAKGADMIAKNYWAHVAPDGTQPWAYFLSAGYQYKYAGENLARDFNDSSSTVEAWMASPSHRENMLSPNYKEIGVAVINGNLTGSETTLVVQFFGTGVSDSIAAKPVAAATAPKVTPPSPNPNPIEVVAVKTPAPAPEVQAEVQSSEQNSAPSLVSPFNLTKNISLVVVFGLLALMVIDFVIISRKNISRIGGRPFAHIAFMGMVATLIVIAKVGRII